MPRKGLERHEHRQPQGGEDDSSRLWHLTSFYAGQDSSRAASPPRWEKTLTRVGTCRIPLYDPCLFSLARREKAGVRDIARPWRLPSPWPPLRGRWDRTSMPCPEPSTPEWEGINL